MLLAQLNMLAQIVGEGDPHGPPEIDAFRMTTVGSIIVLGPYVVKLINRCVPCSGWLSKVPAFVPVVFVNLALCLIAKYVFKTLPGDIGNLSYQVLTTSLASSGFYVWFFQGKALTPVSETRTARREAEKSIPKLEVEIEQAKKDVATQQPLSEQNRLASSLGQPTSETTPAQDRLDKLVTQKKTAEAISYPASVPYTQLKDGIGDLFRKDRVAEVTELPNIQDCVAANPYVDETIIDPENVVIDQISASAPTEKEQQDEIDRRSVRRPNGGTPFQSKKNFVDGE